MKGTIIGVGMIAFMVFVSNLTNTLEIGKPFFAMMGSAVVLLFICEIASYRNSEEK